MNLLLSVLIDILHDQAPSIIACIKIGEIDNRPWIELLGWNHVAFDVFDEHIANGIFWQHLEIWPSLGNKVGWTIGGVFKLAMDFLDV